MSQPRLTGSRIRERRLALGHRQTDLAREVGISPAYLNLIEHNRRRIGGKLVVDLARVLGCEPAQLTEGAEDALVTALREADARGGAAVSSPQADPAPGGGVAAGAAQKPVAEREPAEDFAGRFPGWAALAVDQARKISALERLVETLSDRLAHDPHLAASLHEVLSSVTAIRSAAAILSDPNIAPDWQARFLRNVREESRRLSESAQGLVTWLDTGADFASTPLSPVDELGAFVAQTGYHFPALEAPGAGPREIEAVVASDPAIADAGAEDLARAMLERYLADARVLPEGAFLASRASGATPTARASGATPTARASGAPPTARASGATPTARASGATPTAHASGAPPTSRAAGDDPARIAAAFGEGVDAVLRRMAALGGKSAGLVTCDSAGALLLRKPVEGFAPPRFGAGCTLWPLYRALSRPAQPVEALIEMPGRIPHLFRARAVALPVPGTGFATPAALEATMLVERVEDAPTPPLPVGTACRVCPRDACLVRREPSILGMDAG